VAASALCGLGCSEAPNDGTIDGGGTAATGGSAATGGASGAAGGGATSGSSGASGGGGTGGATGSIGVTMVIDPLVVPELPTTTLAFTLRLDADPPSEGVRLYVKGDRAQGLTQLDLFALSVAPRSNPLPAGDLDFSGFVLLMKEREVTVSVRSFDDGVSEAPSFLTLELVPFDRVPWGTSTVNDEAATLPYEVRTQPIRIELRDAP
jgi:hypothetical protein